jgi:hypothetical protein
MSWKYRPETGLPIERIDSDTLFAVDCGSWRCCEPGFGDDVGEGVGVPLGDAEIDRDGSTGFGLVGRSDGVFVGALGVGLGAPGAVGEGDIDGDVVRAGRNVGSANAGTGAINAATTAPTRAVRPMARIKVCGDQPRRCMETANHSNSDPRIQPTKDSARRSVVGWIDAWLRGADQLSGHFRLPVDADPGGSDGKGRLVAVNARFTRLTVSPDRHPR